MINKTPVTPRMSPKTPLGHSAEETLNLILDSLNVWTLQLTAGHLLDWMANIDRSSFASSGHDVRPLSHSCIVRAPRLGSTTQLLADIADRSAMDSSCRVGAACF
jgi:hypothetical protein